MQSSTHIIDFMVNTEVLGNELSARMAAAETAQAVNDAYYDALALLEATRRKATAGLSSFVIDSRRGRLDAQGERMRASIDSDIADLKHQALGMAQLRNRQLRMRQVPYAS